MQQNRSITEMEWKVLEYLMALGKYPVPVHKDSIVVRNLEDGGMGSFLIFEDANMINEHRLFGAQLCEYSFEDDDSIPVFVSLNVDSNGRLFEVDVWKSDFSPVSSLKTPKH